MVLVNLLIGLVNDGNEQIQQHDEGHELAHIHKNPEQNLLAVLDYQPISIRQLIKLGGVVRPKRDE